jgi:hypothetical protein
VHVQTIAILLWAFHKTGVFKRVDRLSSYTPHQQAYVAMASSGIIFTLGALVALACEIARSNAVYSVNAIVSGIPICGLVVLTVG